LNPTPADRLVVPVELVAREIPGDAPPAVRMRQAAKRLRRAHRVQVIGWLSSEELAALKAGKIPVDLDTCQVLTQETP
jgi:hypothetical protein